MALSGMFLSAWLVKYGVEESIKTREQKESLSITYRYAYNRLSVIGRNAFYFIIFKGNPPEYPDPELSIYLGLAGMAVATPAGLAESNIDKNLKYLANQLDAIFKEALWGGNKEILSDISERIYMFHYSILEDMQILRSKLIPKIRSQLDESNDSEKDEIKARISDFERAIVDLSNIDVKVLKKGDPKDAIESIHEAFIYMVDIAVLLSDKIGLIDYSEIFDKEITDEKIALRNTEFYIERCMKKARP